MADEPMRFVYEVDLDQVRQCYGGPNWKCPGCRAKIGCGTVAPRLIAAPVYSAPSDDMDLATGMLAIMVTCQQCRLVSFYQPRSEWYTAREIPFFPDPHPPSPGLREV